MQYTLPPTAILRDPFTTVIPDIVFGPPALETQVGYDLWVGIAQDVAQAQSESFANQAGTSAIGNACRDPLDFWNRDILRHRRVFGRHHVPSVRTDADATYVIAKADNALVRANPIVACVPDSTRPKGQFK